MGERKEDNFVSKQKGRGRRKLPMRGETLFSKCMVRELDGGCGRKKKWRIERKGATPKKERETRIGWEKECFRGFHKRSGRSRNTKRNNWRGKKKSIRLKREIRKYAAGEE